MLLVQSKWSDGIDWKDAGEFADGVRKLIAANWQAFSGNKKIFDRRNELGIALESAAKLLLITVHHGPHPADNAVLKRVSDLADEIDGGSGLASARHLHQLHLLDELRQESEPPKVDADLYLSNWGEIKDPYPAVFGRVQGQAIAELWKRHPHLAHMNLRDYSRRSDVNQAIAQTAKKEPHHFWYFNNGLTIICDSITPAIYGRLQKDVALFRFEGISLVNGAQTTGIVADNFDAIPEAEKANLWIQLRAIAVKHCPEDFPKSVTKYTNLQNAIGVQDFVGLDPLHSRIATDFALEKRRYVFRWDEDEPTGNNGCSLREVTVALACANPDPWFAVQAKREISQLWLTDSARYKDLFHPDLTVTKIWNAVKILREVDQVVASHENDSTPRASLVANHLQRIVLHIVFQDPDIAGWDVAKDESILAKVKGVANRAFEAVQIDTDLFHRNEYLASVSKNHEKCRLLVARLRNLPSGPQREWLF